MDANAVVQLLPLVLIFALFWFLILRPARKKQQATAALRASLAVGDTVLLGSGFYGRIEYLDDESHQLRLEIAPGVVVRAHRDAVVSKEHSAADAGPAAGSAEPSETDGDDSGSRP